MELDGLALIDWQRTALTRAGVRPVIVVTGYRSADITERGLHALHNTSWHRSNMVASLMVALEQLAPPYLVSYSDIVYDPAHVSRLLAAPGDVAITYDAKWAELWSRRFDDPLSDAETFEMSSVTVVQAEAGLGKTWLAVKQRSKRVSLCPPI